MPEAEIGGITAGADITISGSSQGGNMRKIVLVFCIINLFCFNLYADRVITPVEHTTTQFRVTDQIVTDNVYTIPQVNSFIANNEREIANNDAQIIKLQERNTTLVVENISLETMKRDAIALGVLELEPVVIEEPIIPEEIR